MKKSNVKISTQVVKPFIQGHAKLIAFHDKLLRSCISYSKTKQNQISRMLKKLKTQVSKEKVVNRKFIQLQKKVRTNPTKALKAQLTNVKKNQRITSKACNQLRMDIAKARQELSLQKVSHLQLVKEGKVLKDLESKFIKSIKMANKPIPSIGKSGVKRSTSRRTSRRRAVGWA